MRIAVTGASGYVGRHVLAALAKSDAALVATSRTRPVHLVSGVEFVSLDMAEPDGAYAALGRPDMLVHLAWGGLPNYLSLHHFEDELPRQYAFLKRLVLDGLPAMLVTGTCYEYGQVDGCLSETSPTHGSNPYAHAKITLRQNLEFLKQAHPFDLTWARLFYSFGEGQGEKSLYSQLHAAIARGDADFPMSPGQQLRDFMPIEDMAEALSQLVIRRGDFGTVNICSGAPVSVRSLVESWLSRAGVSTRLNLGRYPYPSYEGMAFWGDRRKLDQIRASPTT